MLFYVEKCSVLSFIGGFRHGQQVHVDTNNLLDSCRLRSNVINGPTLLGAAYIASNTP
jgi:hypothetical protein